MKELSDRIRVYRANPVLMVQEVFGVEPDPWQIEALNALPTEEKIGLKACKGPGKTAWEAWAAWWFLLCFPFPKIAATSISADNLADNLWTEMAKWRDKSPALKAMFEWTKTRIFARDHSEQWWMSARSWPRSADATRQADTLAGLHADYIMFILDESGGIPDAVMASAEAALSSCKLGRIIQAGNPTMLSGPLYRASTTQRKMNPTDTGKWWVREITGDPDDPKRSSRISVQWARDMIDQYGRDHPYVLVNVFGQFPPSSFNALIGPDEVTASMNRVYRDHDIGAAAKVLGVDVALYGDDQSVICPRQGLQVFNMMKYRNLNSIQGAGQVSRKWEDWDADAAFVDATGGFGSGWIDNLIALGRAPIGVHFSGEAHDKLRYANKRAEMAFEAVAWIKRGGALPHDSALLSALTQTTYTFKGDRMILEPKDMVKSKLNGHSPDEFDAFILTFAEPIASKHAVQNRQRVRSAVREEYNPFHDLG